MRLAGRSLSVRSAGWGSGPDVPRFRPFADVSCRPGTRLWPFLTIGHGGQGPSMRSTWRFPAGRASAVALYPKGIPNVGGVPPRAVSWARVPSDGRDSRALAVIRGLSSSPVPWSGAGKRKRRLTFSPQRAIVAVKGDREAARVRHEPRTLRPAPPRETSRAGAGAGARLGHQPSHVLLRHGP
jgi:hypothetical protein